MGYCGKCNREVNKTQGGKPIPEDKKVICNECLEAEIAKL